jgi:hypothetical protein
MPPKSPPIPPATGPFNRLGVILVLCAVAGCQPANNWRNVTAPGPQALQLLWPCKPEHAQRPQRFAGLDQPTVNVHLMHCEADGALWALSVVTAATPADRLKLPGTLREGLARNLTPPQGPVAQTERVNPGWRLRHATSHPDVGQFWLRGHRPGASGPPQPVTVSVWQFTKGMTLYQASVWQNTLQVDDPRLQTFTEGINFPD